MKRNLELVRAILLAMEAAPHGFAPEPFTVKGYDQETIGHHVWLMRQGGLLTAADVTAHHAITSRRLRRQFDHLLNDRRVRIRASSSPSSKRRA